MEKLPLHQLLKAMMTKEEVAQVIAYCDENKISYKQRLSELGISPWNFYDAKRKYAPKEEGENVHIPEHVRSAGDVEIVHL